jgi:TonB-linked SusC/RagA family outer membrane protein
MRKVILTMLIALGFVLGAGAQDRTISGRVTDEKGAPIEGVSVTSSDNKKGTRTDANGNYEIKIASNTKSLAFSDVNFESISKTIGNKSSINVSMNGKKGSLEEVVVVGYQSIKKKEIIGSVTSVGGKEIAQKPIVNIGQLLQGKAPGLQITGEGGRPGSNAFIRIRGVGSINASAEPLIIFDGVQISANAYAAINPNDIEDIAVLKDAAASALYGSRAGNGVLVITSKKGKGVPELRYSFQYGKSRVLPLNNIRLMNSAEKLQYEYEGKYTNPNLTTLITSKINAGVLATGSTLLTISDANRQLLWDELISKGAGDWRDYYLRDATTKTHELSLSGSADKMRYYFSVNKNDNEGVVFGSYFNRLGARLNVEYQAKDWFKIGTNLNVVGTKESLERELFNTQSSYTAIFLNNPYEPVYNADGTYNLTNQGFSPLEGSTNNTNVLNRIAGFATLFGEVKMLKYLTLKSTLGINYNTLNQENYLKGGSNLAAILGYNQKSDVFNREVAYVFTNTANWKQTLGSTKHSINILAGQEFNKNKIYQLQAVARNFPTNTVTTLDNAGTPFAATTTRADFALISYFGNLSYDYNKKYYLTGSIRRDGSSRFGVNNRFANFSAIGVAWDIKKEKFVDNINFISALKVKASIGTSGNNTVGNYDNLGTYQLNVRYSDLPAASPFRLPNADLSWEINKTNDLALEFGFLKDRITGSVGLFKRVTSNLLYDVQVSQATGFANYRGNIGELENKGVELELTGNIIRKKNLNWSITATYTGVDNKITSLFSDDVPNGLGRLKVGEPINTFFLVRYSGVNPANGKVQYFKKDGSLTEIYAASDAVLLEGKSPIVKFYGSLNTSFSYKFFDLSAQFYYSGGNYIYNNQYAQGVRNGTGLPNAQFTDASNYWKKPGDIVPFPNLNDASQRVLNTSDQYLEKGDYITLRDVTVGYTLSPEIASKIRLKGFRFFVQGTNLYMGTKFRGLPEVGQNNRETPGNPGQQLTYAYPQARAVTVGFDVKF